MKNITPKVESVKEFGLATFETFKAKPAKSIFLLAGAVVMIAETVLMLAIVTHTLPVIIVFMPPLLATFPVIELYSDIKYTLFERFRQQHTLEKLSNKDIVLILEATHDYNQCYQVDQRNLFKSIKAHYPIAFEKVSSIVDIAEHIVRARELGNIIKSVWIRGHGCSTSVQLSETQSLTLDNVHFLQRIFSLIDLEATIILDSCGTASEKKVSICVARKIALMALGRTVFATAKATTARFIRIDNENSLHVKFMSKPPSSKKFVIRHFSKIFNYIKANIYILSNGSRVFKSFVRPATVKYCYASNIDKGSEGTAPLVIA